MVRITLCLAGSIFLTAASPVFAAPGAGLTPAARPTLVETTQGYHRNCTWVNGGWHYKNGSRHLVCRPYSPGRGYIWHREGNRFGWYHTARKEWHHKNW